MKFNALVAFVPISSAPNHSRSMTSAVPLCMAATNHEDPDKDFSRRSFLRQKTTIVTSAAFYGFLVNFDNHPSNCQCSTCEGSGCAGNGHDEFCQCSNCLINGRVIGNHDKTCQCNSCMRLGPLAANAYERDVGDENRSPETYAMNLQVRFSSCLMAK